MKSTILSIFNFANTYKKYYIYSIILAILGVLFSILPYFLIYKIIFNLISGVKDFNLYLNLLFISIILWVLRILFHSLSTTLSHKATFAVISNIRRDLIQKLSTMPLGDVLKVPSGTMKSILVEKVDSIETLLAHIVPEMTSNLLVPIVVFIYILTINWKMALISLVPIPIGFFFYFCMMKDYQKDYDNYVNKNKILNATAVEYISGIKVIKTFNQSAESYKKFSIAAKEAAHSAIDWMKKCNIYFSLALEVFPTVLISVLPLGSLLYINNSLSIEDFIFIIILSLGLTKPLVTAMSYSDDLAKVKTTVNTINSILQNKDLIRANHLNTPLIAPNIKFRNVDFAYDEVQVLNNVNLDINFGSTTALVGPSGGGKSTIAKLLLSLWDINSGTISIGGVDIKDIPLDKLNELISYVSQDNFLFNDTILNNIRIGNLSASDNEVKKIAKLSGCEEFILKLENGYDTIVGHSGNHLSGGERQRITIARAMLKNSDIIILDEATAYTDPENEYIIQKSVSKLVKGKTLIVIAHRLSTIINSDEIIVVNNGKIIDHGNHSYLLSNCSLYKSMWESHTNSKDSLEGVY